MGFGLAVVSGPVDSLGTLVNMCKCAGRASFCACALTAMSNNLYDTRWTVKAKFDDLYPLLFVMVLVVGWGWGGIITLGLCVSLSNYVFFIAVFVTQHREQTS